MADVLIVGDGPGGLSAALFLAKKGLAVTVIGPDETPMHKAKLYNYLGIDEITGSDFMAAARSQVERFGAKLVSGTVTAMVVDGDAFAATTDAGETHTGRYLILAMGSKRDLAAGLGVERREDGTIVTDSDQKTTIDGCYALGWSTHRHKTQAIIAAGDGARAALDILSIEKGEDVHDFDVVS